MSTLTTRDLMPEALRCWWRYIGHYPGGDLFTLFDEHALRVLLSGDSAA